MNNIRQKHFDPVLLEEGKNETAAALSTAKAITGQEHVLTSLERSRVTGNIAVGVAIKNVCKSQLLNEDMLDDKCKC